MTVAEQLAAVNLEMQQLQLEDLRDRVNLSRMQKDERLENLRRIRMDLEAQQREREYRQSICQHKKGGKDVRGLVAGNDVNHSIFVTTYPTGITEAMCSRCEKVWAPPTLELKKIDPKLYREQEREYVRVLNLPTDNMPSGRKLFDIRRTAA